MKKYLLLTITKTETNSPKNENFNTYDVEKKKFNAIEEVKEYLISQYGKVPKVKESNKVFIDTDSGIMEVGFTYSYWAPPASYGDINHWCCDWISVESIESTPLLLS